MIFRYICSFAWRGLYRKKLFDALDMTCFTWKCISKGHIGNKKRKIPRFLKNEGYFVYKKSMRPNKLNDGVHNLGKKIERRRNAVLAKTKVFRFWIYYMCPAVICQHSREQKFWQIIVFMILKKCRNNLACKIIITLD